MIALIVILAVLILLMLVKVGIAAAYDSEGAMFAIKIGPVRKQLLPKAKPAEKAKKPKREKKQKPEKETESVKPAKPKQIMELSFLFNLAKIGLHALNRFRISLRVDLFRLRFIMASDDPFTTATTYGYIQAAVGALAPRIRRAFTVRESHVEMGTDFLASKPEIEARLELTIRIGRIFGVLFATGFEFLCYMIKRRLQKRRDAKPGKREAVSPAAEKSPQQKSA